jgi:hypothetical protein
LGHFYLLLALLALLALYVGWQLMRALSPRHRFPYVVDPVLFTPAQRRFLGVLERAMGRGYRVYGMVRVADVVGLRPRLGPRARRRAYERLGDRRFHFLVCTADSSAIACAVNLAPRSRLGLGAPRDGLDRICAAAGLPFVRFRESEVPSVVEIEERVFGAMHTVRMDSPEQDELPREEAQEALAGLSEALREGAGTRRPKAPGKAKGPSAASGVRRRPPPAPAADDAPPSRRDPVLHANEPAPLGDDEGPAFSIPLDTDIDLGDDRRVSRLGRG